MTRLQRMRNRQAERAAKIADRAERRETLRWAQELADMTGQSQVVVRDRQNGHHRILPHAIRKGEPGGVIIAPKRAS